MNDSVIVAAAAKSSPATDQTGPSAEPDCHKGPDSQRGVEKGSGIGDGIVQVNQGVNIGHVAVQPTESVQHGEYATKQSEDEKSHLTLPDKQVLLASSERKVQQDSGTPYLQYTGWHAADTSSKDTSAEPDCHPAQHSERLIMDQAANNNHMEVQRVVHITEQLVDTECIKVDEGDHPASSHKRVFPASSTQKWEGYSPATSYPCHTASPAARTFPEENSQDFPSIMNPHDPVSQYLQPHTASGDGEPGFEGAETNHKSFSHVVNLLGCYKTTLRRSDLTTFIVITAFTVYTLLLC